MVGGEVAGSDTKRRGRKRKNAEVQNVMSDRDGKRRVFATRPMVYVGRYVKKEFEGSGVFLGKIVYYDSGLYRVDYVDGDFEDLESNEAKELLIEEGDLKGKWLERRKRLDELVLNKYGKEKGMAVDRNVGLGNVVRDKVEAAPISVEMSTNVSNCNHVKGRQSDGDCHGDLGTSSELSDEGPELKSISEVAEVPLFPPPELPSSSGNIGIPEEYVSHLLSVYSFLRSFSIQLFLSPFGLDDFVGSLNCTLPNTLMESVHVALLRTLRYHLENCSTNGSERASKCLRFLDWTLLDTLTWPIYLVHYLKVMSYTNGPEWKHFCYHAMEKDYFTLSAGLKLLALQILCDDVLDSEAVRSEIDVHEESEVGIESDAVMATIPSSEPRRVHPRYTNTSACKDQEAMRMIAVSRVTSKVGGEDAGSDDQDGNSDECNLCGMDGMLLCCDGCPSSYHSRCIGVSKLSISEGEWFCPECTMNKIGPIFTRETSLRGAKVFGIDPYEQVFVGTCNYLLVLNGSINSKICLRYYSQDDVPRLLEALHSNICHISLYKEICKGIISCWEIPESVLYSICSTPETGVPDQLCRTGMRSDQLEQNSDCDLLKNSSQTSLNTDVLEQTAIQSAANQQADQFNSTIHNKYKVVRDVVNGRRVRPTADKHLFMGSSFKVQAYNNNYLHGDFAASAAASLDALTPDNVQAPSSNSVGSRRKVMYANYALQAKAFSAAAIRFFWPHTEKKLIEGPRERCSWCLSCKAPVASKRGCLLNAAAVMATKGAIKVLGTLGPPKNVEGSIPSIATYIIFMEESLSGLTEGPFLSSLFRKQWRKQLEKAASCSAIKALLLEFEENIRTVAVSGDWVKLVDGWSAESSVVQCKANAVSSSQKRRPGRRGRKASVVTEVAGDYSQDTLTDITWWRGGHLLKFIPQKGTLPHVFVKKAARQGGTKRISGVYYTEGVETAKRNRQLVWRAAVDMCKNAAQLALQVRYLDLHVKWADLVRPEQSAQETKGPETESSVFRNAFICDKKIADSEIRYCVAFGSQKHLPSKVIKNILETEQIEDGEEKYWFSEFRIPLYLIKEFEVNAARKASRTGEKSQRLSSKLRRKQLKASHKNIFFYLERKRDNNVKVPCDSCRLGVSLGNAVQCSACQGLCHESCTVSSTVPMSEEVQYMSTCKECYQARVQSEIQKNESPTSPLLFRGQVFSSAERSFSYKQGSTSTEILEKYANAKPKKETRPASLSKPKSNWGLVWRKKKAEEHIGDDFIIRNILLKGNLHTHSLKPMCHLCNQPYRPDLMYIHCEACNNWFHADAVGLHEEKIFDLVGFKCCKCRRIRSPTCPYSALSEVKQLRVKGPKLENMTISAIHGSMEEQHDFLIRSEGISHFAHDDPLLISSSEVHPQMYHECNTATVSVPQKLPVRRSAKREKDENLFTVDGSSYAVSSTSFDGQIGDSVEELALPLVEWDVSANGFDDNMMFDFDCLDNVDAEFEPQTYFSFNELLAADDSGLLQGVEPSADATENWEMSNAIQKNKYPNSLVNQPGALVPKDFATDSVCHICSDRDPPPDRVCQTCGAWIHINCSPWIEPPSGNSGWRCGNCREWL